MLDDIDLIKRVDKDNALKVVGDTAERLAYSPQIEGDIKHNNEINKVIIVGMGGSCLAGLMIKNWLDAIYDFPYPLEVVRDYVVPAYTDQNTLVICVSVSGNTEETISAFYDADAHKAQLAVISSGGKIADIAKDLNLPYIKLEKISQPRYGIDMHLRAITKLLASYKLIDNQPYEEIAKCQSTLSAYARQLSATMATKQNPAKQIAERAVGKTVLVYSSRLFYPLAYKWKTSFNENAKNTIWCNEFPEFNHNEFIGWTSHPIEKPFCIINLRSQLDNPRINERIDLTERLLSGQRPAAIEVALAGQGYLEQLLCGAMLGDFVSIYLAIINNINPTPVELVEKFKKELS